MYVYKPSPSDYYSVPQNIYVPEYPRSRVVWLSACRVPVADISMFLKQLELF